MSRKKSSCDAQQTLALTLHKIFTNLIIFYFRTVPVYLVM